MRRTPIALTLGDPAGIGPELALTALADPAVADLDIDLIGSRALLLRVAAALAARGRIVPVPARIIDPDPGFAADIVVPGAIAAAAGAAAACWIEYAIASCRAGQHAALVTGPIHKQAIHAAGVPFPGHTEWLAERCGLTSDDVTMLMLADAPGPAGLLADSFLAVALATCHQPLMSVAASLTPQRIVAAGLRLAAALRRLRGRPPRLAVLGLNPHAGEGGLLGHEDERARIAVGELLQSGIDADGPLSPDAAFTRAQRARYDGFVCLYHDQGLIPFKALHVDDGVNVTLGLPIVRTSVDHGTAFDIAWQGRASCTSLISALRLAHRLASDEG